MGPGVDAGAARGSFGVEGFGVGEQFEGSRVGLAIVDHVVEVDAGDAVAVEDESEADADC